MEGCQESGHLPSVGLILTACLEFLYVFLVAIENFKKPLKASRLFNFQIEN